MIATKPFILYDLPKSRTTQAFFSGSNIEKIWEGLDTFLSNCTTTSFTEATKIILTAYTAYREDKNPEIANKIILTTKSIFGPGRPKTMGEGYPKETTWELQKEDLLKAIAYLNKGQPWPKYSFGPVELFITYRFKLIDPSTKKELPNQEFTSSILIWLSKRCSCSPDLWLPFEDADKPFYDYLKATEIYMPFKLEHKYLKLGKPNKLKTNHQFKKLSSL